MMDTPELFRISTKAVICVDGQVLLLRTPAGNWDLPGGGLEPGEDIETSLARELREEMGVFVPPGRVIYCGIRRRDPPRQNVVVVTYLCTMKTDLSVIVLSEEHDEARLFGADEIDALGLVDSYREAVERAFVYLSSAG